MNKINLLVCVCSAVLLVGCDGTPSDENQTVDNDIIAQSVELPKFQLSKSGELSAVLYGISCGSNQHLSSNPSVSLIINGTPVEFARECSDSILSFSPINNTENAIFTDLIVSSTNLSCRYFSGTRTYVYNDWQLAPIKEALKQFQ
ncbi:hypothetical protein L4C54_11925 [Vibrio lamellibrachiae]|uniref:hypothetical protein n=1 Tax=Vibrio lamellibrachiae TaxID=2910253 RepID=UPI003D10B9EB